MNRLSVWKLGLAAAVMFIALNVLCAIAVTLWPDATVAAFNSWFHALDLRLAMPPGGKPLTVTQVVAGAVSGGIVSFIGGAILASIYNLLSTAPKP